MRTFFAALLGFVAAGVLFAVALFTLGNSDAWQARAAALIELIRRDDRGERSPDPRREQTRLDERQRRAHQQQGELQEQRRERLTLLTATLRADPIARLAAAETHLFQESERERARAASGGLFVRLVEPVQIDERTVLQRGTAVELVGADRGNVITIRHNGARYQLSPCQTELRAISGDVCEE
jgi:hypothetical protein